MGVICSPLLAQFGYLGSQRAHTRHLSAPVLWKLEQLFGSAAAAVPAPRAGGMMPHPSLQEQVKSKGLGSQCPSEGLHVCPPSPCL